ncbi:uncharacterized protein BKA78DRAFT_381672 [Phyllosticta capitalensis]|uniref:uncharacterized protein n=1 Tax=Phyllosticta capitalensis TaxID=121624 RepID=UPI00313022C8
MRSRITTEVMQSLRSLKEWRRMEQGMKLTGESGRTYVIGGESWMLPEHMRFAKDIHNEQLSFHVKQPQKKKSISLDYNVGRELRSFGKELRMNEIFNGANFLWQQVDTILPTFDSETEPPRVVYEAMWKTIFEARTMRTFTRREVKLIMRSTLLALQEIERKGFVHTNLTTEYLLLPTEKLDLCKPKEFFAKIANTASCSVPSQVHKVDWRQPSSFHAPEMYFSKPVSFPAHIWSWAMILSHLLESRAALKSGRFESAFIGSMFETWNLPRNNYSNQGQILFGELVCHFNVDFCEYFADCDMPDYEPCEESDWKEHMRNKGVLDEDICFLDWILDPNPETRPTSEQIIETGFLEWNEDDVEEEES